MGELRQQPNPRDAKPERRRTPRGAGRKRTCLYCYHPFRVERTSEHCPACGELNLRIDQETYWTREPRLVTVETILKALIVLVISSLSALMLLTISGGGMGQGWAAGFPLLVGWILWETAGLVTRRRAVLDMGLLWPAILICVGIGPPLFLLLLEASVDGSAVAEILGGGLVWAAPWVIPAFLVRLLGRRFARFREERIASGAAGIPASTADGVS